MDPETVSVENPYGLGALWAQGDFVAKGTLILLALMSAYSWFIIFTKWWEQRRLVGSIIGSFDGWRVPRTGQACGSGSHEHGEGALRSGGMRHRKKQHSWC